MAGGVSRWTALVEYYANTVWRGNARDTTRVAIILLSTVKLLRCTVHHNSHRRLLPSQPLRRRLHAEQVSTDLSIGFDGRYYLSFSLLLFFFFFKSPLWSWQLHVPPLSPPCVLYYSRTVLYYGSAFFVGFIDQVRSWWKLFRSKRLIMVTRFDLSVSSVSASFIRRFVGFG